MVEQLESAGKGFYSKYIYNDLLSLRHTPKAALDKVKKSVLIESKKQVPSSPNKNQMSEEVLKVIEEVMSKRGYRASKEEKKELMKNSSVREVLKDKSSMNNIRTINRNNEGSTCAESSIDKPNKNCIQIIEPFNSAKEDNIKETLVKAMVVIKLLCDQIAFLDEKKEAKFTQLANEVEKLIIGNTVVKDIIDVLERMKTIMTVENEHILSKKLEILTKKYGTNSKSIQRVAIKPNTLIKDESFDKDPFMSTLRTFIKSPDDSGLTNKTKDKLIELTSNEKANLKMRFQQNLKSIIKEKTLSTSRSIENWKQFIAEMENMTESEDEPIRRPLNRKIKAMELPYNDNKENIDPSKARIKTDHKKTEPVSIDLTSIEEVMSSFLFGFKDIRSELTQIGKAIQSENS